MVFKFQSSNNSKLKRAMLVFSLAFIVMMIVLAISGFIPFGDKTMLINDMDIQYIEYMKGFNTSFNDFVFYNYFSGVGASMLPMFTYYLSSPIQWILLLFDNSQIYGLITIIYCIKIALAVMTMDIYLRYRYGSDKKTLVFSMCYGFSSMGLVYSQSIMWLDGLFFLPLLVMGVEIIIKEDKVYPLFIFTALSLFCNYYTAIMSLIFSGITCLIRLFQTNKSIKEGCKLVMHAFISVILGVGVNMVLLLPSLLSILSNRASADDVLTVSTMKDRLLGLNSFFMLDKAITLGIEKSYIYCGLLCILLCVASFFSKKLSRRDKLAHACFIVVLIASVAISFLYSGWHLFSMPYGFPTRFAFCISFCIIMIAASLDEVEFKAVGISLLLVSILLCLKYLSGFSMNSIFVNLLFMGLLAIFLVKKKEIILYLVVLELIGNGVFVFNSLNQDNVYDGYAYIDEVVSYDQTMEKIVSSLEIDDNVRLENMSERNLNESYAYGFSSISHYSSTYNKKIHDFLAHYGATGRLFGSEYDGTTLFLDSLLGIKYVLHDESEYLAHSTLDHYNKIDEVDGIGIYENPYVLPIAFMSDPVEEADLSVYHKTIYQNDIANRLNAEDNLFIEHGTNGIYAWDANCISEAPYIFQNTYQEGYPSKVGIYPDFKDVQEGYIGYMQLRYVDSETWYSLYVDNSYVGHFYTGYDSGTRYLNEISSNKEMEVALNLDHEFLRFEDAYFYSMNMDVFENLINKLQRYAKVEYRRDKDTLTLTTNLDYPQDLILTYPMDDGWSCKVNGELKDIKAYESTFMKISLDAGENEIVLTYVPKGFKLGLAISITSMLCVLCWLGYQKKKTRC